MKSASGVVVLFVLLAPATVTGQHEAHRATFSTFLEVVNTRDLDRLETLVTEDFVRHSQATPGVVIDSRGDFRTFLEADFATVPDSRVECPMMTGEGDLLAVWCEYTGTQEGAWGPFPPSGERVDLDFAAFLRFEAGKIAEMWVIWDNLTALTQLGHFPFAAREDTP
jgi:steroid delta-isomerase-like uncharacterized protein